jgi:hypothetical protein
VTVTIDHGRIPAAGHAPRQVQAQQIRWLAQRDADCAGRPGEELINCLDDEYTQRLAALLRFA